MGLDLDKAVNSIKKAGIELESPKESIKAIANKADLTPKELHEIILKDQPQKPAPPKAGNSIKPEETHSGSGAGIGRMPLENYCAKYNLDLNTALGILREKGAVVDKSTTIREIAASLGLSSPHEISSLLNP